MEKIFLNNNWYKSSSRIYFRRKSFTKNYYYKYPDCNKKDLDMIVSSARVGLNNYKSVSLEKRSKLLREVASKILKNYKKIAKLESEETGKKLKNCENEVLHSADIWRFAANNINSLRAKTLRLNKKNYGEIIHDPVGLVSLIVPWNFPMVVASERLPFILAAGNSVIIKPSEYASQSLIFLVKVLKKVSFPDGVINLLYGKGPSIGKKIVECEKINMISFTGSTDVGKKIMNGSGKYIRRLSLELGGKNSIIILNDADINKSVSIAIDSFCLNSGQCCVATTKLLVQSKIKSKFIEKLISELSSIKDYKKIFGPITTKKQFNKIHSILKKNKTFDKNIIYGNTSIKKGQFITPIVYDNLPKNNIINKIEIFGPILSITNFNKEDEAIEIANDTNYGLSAIVCGKNKNKLSYIAKNLSSGRIWINNSIKTNFPKLPIGGYKESGLNRECGLEGFKTYSEIKSIIS